MSLLRIDADDRSRARGRLGAQAAGETASGRASQRCRAARQRRSGATRRKIPADRRGGEEQGQSPRPQISRIAQEGSGRADHKADQRHRPRLIRPPTPRPSSMHRLRAIFLAALFLCAAAVSEAADRAQPVRRVIIVSIDGLMPATYVAPDVHGLAIPTLREIVKNGAWSDGARSVFPTVTYPAHASIATGVNPGVHGIVSNGAFDPLGKNQQGWRWYAEDIRAPTLWDAARLRGLTAALIWWPTTVGARAAAVVPEYWRAGSEDDVKLVRALATPGLLDAVAARFPAFNENFTPPALQDEALTDIAVHAIETVKPNLLMLHLPRVDHEEHEGGPFSD